MEDSHRRMWMIALIAILAFTLLGIILFTTRWWAAGENTQTLLPMMDMARMLA
jgi:hypothetical protein